MQERFLDSQRIAFLKGDLRRDEYMKLVNKQPKIDFKALADELSGNQSWKVFNEKLAQLRDNPRKLSF